MRRMIPVFKTIALVIIAPAVIYFGSLSKSASLWKEYKAMEGSVCNVCSGESTYEIQAGSPLLSTGDILATLMPACCSTGVSLVSYSPEMVSFATHMGLFRAELVLSGRFTSLLSVMSCIAELTQVKTSVAEFRCDERMRREGYLMLILELVQLERLRKVDYDEERG